MAIKYDLFKLNEIKDTGGKYRARAVSRGKIDTEHLARWMNQTSGISMATAKGCIEILTDCLLDFVSDGYEVQVGELGYFSASVTSKLVDDPNDIRAESIHFNRLNFRAGIKAKRRIKRAGIEKVNNPRTKRKLPESTREQRAEKLKEYLSSAEPFVTRAGYVKITGVVRKNAAIDDLNAFVGEGWLKRHGAGRTVIYMLGDMNG